MEMAIAVAPAQPAFSVGGVIGRTFSTWWRNLVPFVALAAIVYAPLLAFVVIGASQGEQVAMLGGPVALRPAGGFAGLPPVIVAVWALMIVMMLVQLGALTYGAIQHLAGRRVTLAALLGMGLRRAWRVLLTGIACGILLLLVTVPLGYVATLAGAASGILTVLGMVAAFVVFIVLGCALVAAVPAVVAEATGPIAAIRRSFALTKGRRFRIFVALLVMLIIAWVAMAITSFLPMLLGGGPSVPATLLGLVGQVITAPLWTLLPAVAYHDLRVEKEGVDTAELAKVFE